MEASVGGATSAELKKQDDEASSADDFVPTSTAKLALLLANILWPSSKSYSTTDSDPADSHGVGGNPSSNLPERLEKVKAELGIADKSDLSGVSSDQANLPSGINLAGRDDSRRDLLSRLLRCSLPTPNTREPQSEQNPQVDGQNADTPVVFEDVGEISIGLLQVLHKWLQQGPSAGTGENGRADAKDYILSIPERQTVLRLAKSTISSMLVPLGQRYILTTDDGAASKIKETLRILLASILPENLNGADSPGPSNSVQTMTIVSNALRSLPIISLIIAHMLLVGWSQQYPPAVFAQLRKNTFHLLENILEPSESLSILGAVGGLSSPKTRRIPTRPMQAKIELIEKDEKVTQNVDSWPPHVKRTVNVLMARQVARKGGVRGLMINVSGTMMGRDEVFDGKRLDHLAKVLAIPAQGSTVQDHIRNIATQLLSILSHSGSDAGLPPRYSHAASYVLQHLSTASSVSYRSEVLGLLSGLIQPAFLPVPPPFAPDDGREVTILTSGSEISKVLSIFLPLLSQVPSSPSYLDSLVTPILPQCFALFCELDRDRTADPVTKRQLQEILESWARGLDSDSVLKGIWRLVTSGRGWGLEDQFHREVFWAPDLSAEGNGNMAICYGRTDNMTSTEFLRSQDLGNEGTFTMKYKEDETARSGEEDDYDRAEGPSRIPFEGESIPEAADLVQVPSPEAIVDLARKARDPSVPTRLYLRCLTSYGATEVVSASNATQSLVFLRIIMMLHEEGSRAIEHNPDEVLTFVEHALRPEAPRDPEQGAVPEMARLNIDATPTSSHSTAHLDSASGDDTDVDRLDLTQTALQLLLSILERHDDFTADRHPMLLIVESHLRRLLSTGNRDDANIANTVLTILAARGAASRHKDRERDSQDRDTTVMDLYEEAIKLLQNPLLPVRAHGLIILQDIVRRADFDPRLSHAILGVLLQALKDDDSYVYLNAVKGLSSLADGVGREVIKAILGEYAAKSEQPIGHLELNFRLRLGEALQQIIGRFDKALAVHVSVLLPPLISVFPDSEFPVVLRASALSLIGSIADTAIEAVLAWRDELISACLDLVELETSVRPAQDGHTANEDGISYESIDPTLARHDKNPVLRRAALVLVNGLLRDASRLSTQSKTDTFPQPAIQVSLRTRSDPSAQVLDSRLTERVFRVVGYSEAVDEDDVVRQHAEDVLSVLRDLALP